MSREGSLEGEGPRTKGVRGEPLSYVAQVGWEGSVQQSLKRVPQSPRGHRTQRQVPPPSRDCRRSPGLHPRQPRLPGPSAHGGPLGSAPSEGLVPAVGTPALTGARRDRRGGAGYLLDASIDVQVDGLGPVA